MQRPWLILWFPHKIYVGIVIVNGNNNNYMKVSYGNYHIKLHEQHFIASGL